MPPSFKSTHTNGAPKAEKEGSKKKISLALQGGGVHGAFTWGVLDALLEDDRFEIEGLSGTSAGGMNAVALAQGLIKGGTDGARTEMRRFWKAVSDAGVQNAAHQAFFSPKEDFFTPPDPLQTFTRLMQNVLSPYQSNPLNVNPLRDLVEDFFDFTVLQSAKHLKLFLCATHVNTGKLKLFTLDTLTPQKMLASACLPFLFQAVEVDGENYWDGGFVGNPAIYPLIYACDTSSIVIVQLTVMNRNRLPLTAQEVIERHKEITYNACLMREMRTIDFVTSLIEKGIIQDKSIKKLNIHLVRNEKFFSTMSLSSALNTSWPFMEKLFEEGRKTAKQWIADNYQHVGVRHSTNLHQEFVAETTTET